jgi:hypothetical protein
MGKIDADIGEHSAMAADSVWARPVAAHLFEILVLRFGPYAEWGHAFMPGFGRNHEFCSFCKNFAKILGTTSTDVRRQIRIVAELHRTKQAGSTGRPWLSGKS